MFIIGVNYEFLMGTNIFRLCAVFGGTYFLGRSIEGLVIDSKSSNKVLGVITNGQRINCQKLVLPALLLPDELKDDRDIKETTIRREIILASDSIMPSEKEELTFLSLPPQKVL